MDELKSVKDYILIKGAKTHNLKNVDVAIPRNKLVVVTGLSGSGKSSLIMDTLFAEGQRRYVESLNSYARQFLSRMNKPDVEYIKGIVPAISLEQRVSTGTTRSTVGSMTEIYDYLRLLYAKIGETYSPISGEKVIKEDINDVLSFIFLHQDGDKIQILSPIAIDKKEDLRRFFERNLQNGFIRFWLKGDIFRVEDILEDEKIFLAFEKESTIYLLIDRIVISKTEGEENRIADSIQLAFEESHGLCCVLVNDQALKQFSNRFERDGMTFETPNIQFFNFNSPFGACTKCEGFGTIIGIDEQLVIPDSNLSVYDYGVAPWKGEKMGWWRDQLIKAAAVSDFPIHKPIAELSEAQYKLLWNGNPHFLGIHSFFKEVEEQTYKIQYRVMLSRFRGRTVCNECSGSRIREDAKYVKIDNKHIGTLLLMPIKDLLSFFENIKLTQSQEAIAFRIITEIIQRLNMMKEVGLDYLTLNRLANTLSGGETQRIHLTRSLGSNLTNSMYILDEPSIGLHPFDTKKLLGVLRHLRNLGNTVVVVEHEEEIIRNADYLIDVGPAAGYLGGEIVFEGKIEDALKENSTLTTKYLLGDLKIEVPKIRRKPFNFVVFEGCKLHNLKNIDFKIPLNSFSVITGVSGSGKTTLVREIIYPALKSTIEGSGIKPNFFRAIKGDFKRLEQIEFIDQNPIGRSSRSNPVTYIKAYDIIRELYAAQSLSKIRGYQPGFFSFNVEGGRCEVCKGEGEILVEMQFLADVHLECESCKGKRFKKEVLEVTYKEKSIFEILELTVDEAVPFFEEQKKLVEMLKPLQHVGLGYVKLGQSSSTLSGGEAQRVKLAAFLKKGTAIKPVLFIFDEPTTGLHFHDIHKLLASFNALIENGHSVLVIEHNLDIIKSADWVIDLGPKAGNEGGYLVAEGTPELVAECNESITGYFLKEKLN